VRTPLTIRRSLPISLAVCMLVGTLLAPRDRVAHAASAVPRDQLSMRAFHSLLVDADGVLWSFGGNYVGQLGVSNDLKKDVPHSHGFRVMTGVKSASAGQYHSLVLKNDGSVWTFGSNSNGQLGVDLRAGSVLPNPTPVQVMSDATAIASGWLHNLVLKTDGTVWAFGSNVSGQLGTTTDVGGYSSVPLQVLSGVSAISAGENHSLVLKTDGSLWSFGSNLFGQLGVSPIGDLSALPTPRQVMTGVASISAEGFHNLVVKTDGSLWTFGSNAYGEAGKETPGGPGQGDGTPTQVLTGVAKVAAGWLHSVVLKNDGTVWTFGFNSLGELGDQATIGTQTMHASPFQVANNAINIAAGGEHSAFQKADGTWWTFGSNYNGELGTSRNQGSYIPNATPLAITALSPLFVPLVPGRLMDTRNGATVDGRGPVGRRGAGQITELDVAGRGGVSADGLAVVLNVTVTGATSGGFVTVWPCGSPQPNASSLNFDTGATIPNAVVTKIGTGGKVCMVSSGETHLIADVNGYFPLYG
jgi:alpha-tubulin suppressor-like RCC1 family protein